MGMGFLLRVLSFICVALFCTDVNGKEQDRVFLKEYMTEILQITPAEITVAVGEERTAVYIVSNIYLLNFIDNWCEENGKSLRELNSENLLTRRGVYSTLVGVYGKDRGYYIISKALDSYEDRVGFMVDFLSEKDKVLTSKEKIYNKKLMCSMLPYMKKGNAESFMDYINKLKI